MIKLRNFITKSKMGKSIAILGLATLVTTSVMAANSLKAYAQTYISGGVDITLDTGAPTTSRNTVYEITDAGPLAQDSSEHDVITVSNRGYSVSKLTSMGYQTLVLIFHLDIWEVDDGYQEIYLYTLNNGTYTQLVTPITSFEHGSGSKNTTQTEYEFYAEIPLSSIKNDKIYVFYSAHGWFADNWKNTNFQYQICASTESQKYSNLRWVSNGV